MKILEDKYPMGSFKGQKTPGRYVDGYLYENLKVLAKAIVRDMTFLGIAFSSTLEVGTGKSVLFTQVGEMWGDLMKKLHNIDVPFTEKNLVFRPRDLLERAFEVPKYSCVLVDEWEDAHYWSELGMTLRQFFRKCRQLNLFILIIIPNFFELPKTYALGRSVFAIDVKFGDDYSRGFYDFYSFNEKKVLYLRGKKEHNYNVTKPCFKGNFTDGYGLPEEEYRKAKAKDLKKTDMEEVKKMSEHDMKISEVYKFYKNRNLFNEENISTKTISLIYNVHERTIKAWISKAKKIYEKNLDVEKIGVA